MANERANRPISLLRILSSESRHAMTGKPPRDCEAAMSGRESAMVASSGRYLTTSKDNKLGSANVKMKTDKPMQMALRSGCNMVLGSIFTPMAKKKNMIPNYAMVSNTTVPLKGKNFAPMTFLCPRSDGPIPDHLNLKQENRCRRMENVAEIPKAPRKHAVGIMADQSRVPNHHYQVAMDVISARMSSSTLNPNAPMFVPLAYRTVEDFSDEWWALVQSSPWFRDYWLQECFHDPQDDPSFVDIYDPVLPEIDALFHDADIINEEGGGDHSKELVSTGALKWRKGRALTEVPRYIEKAPKIVNVKVSPRTIQQPRL
ncbi:hypothetical protein FEM48_ZijujUnG0118100 [Ziziphus jujuba var. spinosa]|uniref:Protein EARLY RESPONSIVE TO DEHYDRATION 15-like n=1 Tax=Ziziphus jujuba var. spinosa TaxID=714518 RepID=A0A978U7W5_ZIZJJ|nr:hypothetical protein FEM48_ZijujUnG0118100 [Ziziphus jujuba var. spinosa]